MHPVKSSSKWLQTAIAFCMIALFTAAGTAWALTPAGTIIGNSATANYYDEDNNPYTTTSNLVQTTVQEVCGITVTPTGASSYSATPGKMLYIPVTVTNGGNGENTFNLTETDGSGKDYGKTFYRDSNQNGIVDPGESSIVSITLNMGETVHVVIAVDVDASASSGDSDQFQFTATGTAPAGCSADTGNMTIDVIEDALIQASKQVDKPVAVPTDTLTYTITFKNVGTKSAKANSTAVSIDGTNYDGILVSDSIPESTTLVTGASGVPNSNPNGYVAWSTDSGTTWTATEPGALGTVTNVGFFMPDTTPANGTQEDVLDADQQGTLNFQVTINDPFTDTDGTVDNQADISYADSGDNNKTTTTNETNTLVPASATADVAIGARDTSSPLNGEEDGTYTDDNTVASAPAGVWVEFTHTAENRDTNHSDIINLSAENKPAGWIVEFYNADGTSKLIDNDGDGNPDLGTLAANDGATTDNDTRNFTIKVFVPANASGNNGGAGWDVDILATSVNNPSEVDRSQDTITTVITAGVDIAQRGDAGDGIDDAADNNTDGAGDADDILPADTTSIDPGNTATYPLQLVNTGGSADSFSLSAAYTAAPATDGTSIKFYLDSDCDASAAYDAEVTDTPLLGGSVISGGIGFAGSKTSFNVYSVANFTVGDTIIIATDGTEHTIDAVATATNTITLSAADGDLSAGLSAGDTVSEMICLVMTVETIDATSAGSYNIVATADSDNSGQNNNMDISLTINEVCDISVTPDQSDQMPAGGTTTYQHTVTNNGNSTKNVRISNVVPGAKLTYTFIADETTYVVSWRKLGGDGVIGGGNETDMTDGQIAALGDVYVNLAPGASAAFKVRVSSPSNVASGTVESADVTATVDFNGNGSFVDAGDCSDKATDTTSIIEGYLQLTKTQTIVNDNGVDASGACTGVADTANPGPCDTIIYTIEYKNIGSKDAKNVIITDSIPDNTTFDSGTNSNACINGADDDDCTGDPDLSGIFVDFDAANNVVRFRVGTGADGTNGGTVAPGESGWVTFKVTIQ